MSTDSSLSGRHVVVIGGTSGIGLAVAEHAAAAGARVTVAARNPERAADLLPAGVTAEKADVASAAATEALFERIGSFDHLVTTAGAGVHGSIRDLTSADARPILDTKFWGYYDAVRAAAKTIATDGSITLVGGGSSRKYPPGVAAMAGINAAVEAFGKAAAVELAPVRVNVIAPGLIDTPAHASMPEEARHAMQAKYAATVPAGRAGLPGDVASAAIFLMTNTFVTGTVIDVDGGLQVS